MSTDNLKSVMDLVQPNIPLLAGPIVSWRYKWWVDDVVYEDCTVLPTRGVILSQTGPAKRYDGDRHGHYAGHSLYLTRDNRGYARLVEVSYSGLFSDRKGAPSELICHSREISPEIAAAHYDPDNLIMAIYTALCRYIDKAPQMVTGIMRQRAITIMQMGQKGISSSTNPPV